MAVHTSGNYVTRATGADLSTSLYCIVKQNSSRQLVLSSAAGDNHFGVIQDVSAAGSGANATAFVRNASGTFKVIAGGNVTINDALTSDGNGHAVSVTAVSAGAVPASEIIGYAQETGVSGQIIEYRATDRRI